MEEGGRDRKVEEAKRSNVGVIRRDRVTRKGEEKRIREKRRIRKAVSCYNSIRGARHQG